MEGNIRDSGSWPVGLSIQNHVDWVHSLDSEVIVIQIDFSGPILGESQFYSPAYILSRYFVMNTMEGEGAILVNRPLQADHEEFIQIFFTNPFARVGTDQDLVPVNGSTLDSVVYIMMIIP